MKNHRCYIAWSITCILFFACIAQASATTTIYKDTGWLLKPDGGGTYTLFPDNNKGGSTSVCTASGCNRNGSSILGPLGKPRPALNPTTFASKANIASASLALGSRLLPWLSVGYGIYDWYTAAGLTQDGDGFSDNAPQFGYVIRQNTTITEYGWWPVSASQQVLDALCAKAGPFLAEGSWSVTAGSTGAACGAWSGTQWQRSQFGVTITNVKRCPGPTGIYDQPIPASGLCTVSTPLTPEQVQQRLQNAPVTAEVLRRALDEILQAGGGVATTGTTATGPASVPGETKTTTSTTPNGTSAVTTYNTTYNYTYNNSTVTITQSETKTNPDGSTETTTDDSPEVDPCIANPESLACAKLGTAEGNPSWETKNVLYQVENLGISGACPAPWVATLRGWNLVMSYQPVCDVAPTVRLGLLAITALSCLFIVLRVTQS